MVMILDDTRKMTQEDADKALAAIAALEVKLVRMLASYEARINALKTEAEGKAEPIRAKIESLGKELGDYVTSNRPKFNKPRSRAISFGDYGLHAVSNVVIDDEERVAKFAAKNPELGLVKTTTSVVKSAVKAAIKGGVKVPGARIASGEEAYYKVSKALLEQAKQDALSD